MELNRFRFYTLYLLGLLSFLFSIVTFGNENDNSKKAGNDRLRTGVQECVLLIPQGPALKSSSELTVIDKDLKTHHHAATEIYYILKGRGQMILGIGKDAERVDLKPGRFIYLPSNVPHQTVSDAPPVKES